MNLLTRLGLQYSRFTVLVMLLLVAVGTASYLGFPKREDPEITVRTAIITASNAGLRLGQLETLVAQPLEETARTVPGVSEVRTQLGGGAVIIEVDLGDDVPEADLKRVFDEIRDDVANTADRLPDGTIGPLVNTDFGDVAIATIALTGAGFSLPEVEQAAKRLRDRLYGLDGVSAVTLHGQQREVITLEVARDRLAAVGTTLDALVAALRTQNVTLPAGSVVTGGLRVPLETTGELRSVEKISATLIELPELGLIRLGDLVDVRRELESPAVRPVYQNGRAAVVVSVEMAGGVDITRIGPDVRNIVERFVADQPIGLEAGFSTFQPDVVDASVRGALVNTVQTFAVVLLVMLLFLGWREALVVASIVPFAVSFAFALMGPFAVELQQVSIAAIIISLGLLVDNGVVIVEDMQRRLGDGADRETAAREAGRQYAVPLAIASTTTVAAFLPLFLLDGTEGEYGYSLGIVVMLMLAGSFLSALYLLPSLAVWTVPAPVADSGTRMLDRVSARYATLVRSCLRWPLSSALVIVVLVLLGASLMRVVPQQLFPFSERAQFLAYVDLPKGSDIATTERTALRFSDWLTGPDNPEVTGVTTYVGAGGPRFVLSLDPADVDPAAAFMIVNTTDFDASVAALSRARDHVLEAFPEARIRLKRLAMGGREPGIDVEISGPDADRLLEAAYEVQAALADAPGLIENRNDWGGRRIVGTVDIAQDRIRAYGLTSQEVSDALEGFLDGRQVSTLREGDDQIPVLLRGRPADRRHFDAILNAAIEVDGRTLAPDQIATLRPRLELSTLRRIDQRRTITVTAISEALSAQGLLEHAQPTLDRLDDALGGAYDIAIAGELENSAEVRERLGAGAPTAIVVMLLALMAQFDSVRRVAITLLAVPLVIAGVGPALWLAGAPLSFFGILGLIALAGIIINNAILLIDQIDIERADRALDDAIAEAARKRFRPILLTSLTTVIGLSPMAFAGGALWESMATLMMGGLAGAALLALIWVPVLYRLAFAGRLRHCAGDHGRRATSAPARSLHGRGREAGSWYG